VKVADGSVKYTSFVTLLGQFEFLRMPFGLTNAPQVFQHMDDIFPDLTRTNKILIYLNDILIITEVLMNIWRFLAMFSIWLDGMGCSFVWINVHFCIAKLFTLDI